MTWAYLLHLRCRPLNSFTPVVGGLLISVRSRHGQKPVMPVMQAALLRVGHHLVSQPAKSISSNLLSTVPLL